SDRRADSGKRRDDPTAGRAPGTIPPGGRASRTLFSCPSVRCGGRSGRSGASSAWASLQHGQDVVEGAGIESAGDPHNRTSMQDDLNQWRWLERCEVGLDDADGEEDGRDWCLAGSIGGRARGGRSLFVVAASQLAAPPEEVGELQPLALPEGADG